MGQHPNGGHAEFRDSALPAAGWRRWQRRLGAARRAADPSASIDEARPRAISAASTTPGIAPADETNEESRGARRIGAAGRSSRSCGRGLHTRGQHQARNEQIASGAARPPSAARLLRAEMQTQSVPLSSASSSAATASNAPIVPRPSAAAAATFSSASSSARIRGGIGQPDRRSQRACQPRICAGPRRARRAAP